MSKYGDVIRQARQTDEYTPANQQTEKPENQQTRKPDLNVAGRSMPKLEQKAEEVNLSIKVPKILRRHWVSEAKRQDTTLTAVIIEALKARFGEAPQ